MKRHVVVLVAVLVAVCCVSVVHAQTVEITEADLAGDSPFEVGVKNPVNPELVGIFQNAPGEEDLFAYALVERDGKYMMFVNLGLKFKGWAEADLDGDEICFGKKRQAKILLTSEGIFRIFKGKSKTKLQRVQ